MTSAVDLDRGEEGEHERRSHDRHDRDARRDGEIDRRRHTALAAERERSRGGDRRGGHVASLRTVSAICIAEKTRMIRVSTTDNAEPYPSLNDTNEF